MDELKFWVLSSYINSGLGSEKGSKALFADHTRRWRFYAKSACYVEISLWFFLRQIGRFVQQLCMHPVVSAEFDSCACVCVQGGSIPPRSHRFKLQYCTAEVSKIPQHERLHCLAILSSSTGVLQCWACGRSSGQLGLRKAFPRRRSQG